ncbi:hypothetical protein [Marilutibacter spongiae]|uniref:Uncharacterized protein n=1 Tax=Marilutibacter spongiae TaxID=2025720 RepID=A0A7W3Y6S3_9GAMM|nr:hypothetical protein [Lysobacter spongiae]MBB1061783.1 hypothetical protein [Lysobacter spongiae]
MEKRILMGSVAALAVMLGFEWLLIATGRPLDVPIDAGFGPIPLAGLLVTAAAMALGGRIATQGFRIFAVLLALLVALSGAVSVQLSSALSHVPEPFSLGEILRYNGAATAASMLAAWLGAALGEWAARRAARPPLSAPGA